MKTITVKELKDLVEKKGWVREQECNDVDCEPEEEWIADGPDSGHVVEECHYFGMASKISTLDSEGIKITFVESFTYYDDGDLDNFSHSNEGQDDIWIIDGVKIVDESGDELDSLYIDCMLFDILPEEFSSIDYSALNLPDFPE